MIAPKLSFFVIIIIKQQFQRLISLAWFVDSSITILATWRYLAQMVRKKMSAVVSIFTEILQEDASLCSLQSHCTSDVCSAPRRTFAISSFHQTSGNAIVSSQCQGDSFSAIKCTSRYDLWDWVTLVQDNSEIHWKKGAKTASCQMPDWLQKQSSTLKSVTIRFKLHLTVGAAQFSSTARAEVQKKVFALVLIRGLFEIRRRRREKGQESSESENRRPSIWHWGYRTKLTGMICYV